MGNCLTPSTGRSQPSQNTQEPRSPERVQPPQSPQQSPPGRRADQSPQSSQQISPHRAHETPQSPQQPAGESAKPRVGKQRTLSFEPSSSSPAQSERSESEIFSSTPQLFPFNELKAATKNFAACRVIGEGGFGSVFKGWVNEQTRTSAMPPSGTAVAVKVLDRSGIQGEKQWLREIKYLGKLRHPNLVRLIGYSSEGDVHRLIVYEYLKNGSLEKHLFDENRKLPSGEMRKPLPWEVRVRIATGVARGLAYMHGLEPPVISRDIKPANILLDDEFNPRISDFGIAKDGPTRGKSHVLTAVVGTSGYTAPEYQLSGKLNTSCDVYSFGVVLIELLTGRKSVDRRRPLEEEILIIWAWPYMSHKFTLSGIMDRNLRGKYNLNIAFAIAHIAQLCIQEKAKLRPPMSDVYASLLWLLQNPNSAPEVPPLPREVSIENAGIPPDDFDPTYFYQGFAGYSP